MAMNDASVRFDTAAIRKFYSGSGDTVHNNLQDMTLDQNLAMVAELQEQGYTTNFEKYTAIWETIYDKPNVKGVSNFVLAYSTLNISQAGKSAKIVSTRSSESRMARSTRSGMYMTRSRSQT